MSIRFQKRIKLLPGLRLNISKSSLGLSLGVPGARASINTRGEVYASAGIPGSGLYAIDRVNLQSRKRSRKKVQPGELAQPIPIPTIFASRKKKALYRSLQVGTVDAILAVADKHPEIRLIAEAHAMPRQLMGTSKDLANLLATAKKLWEKRNEFAEEPLFYEYAKGAEIALTAAPGVQIPMEYGLIPLGLIYVELLQLNQDFKKALEVAETLPANQATALAVCESEVQLGRWEGVLETTEEIENVDDATALLLIYRAIALRELGHLDASIESLRRARSSKKRHEDVLNKALFERARTYQVLGKASQAKKDLEKIMATDSDFPGVDAFLDELSKD
jgi:tetratricopeptide (TPR) repeat protein